MNKPDIIDPRLVRLLGEPTRSERHAIELTATHGFVCGLGTQDAQDLALTAMWAIHHSKDCTSTDIIDALAPNLPTQRRHEIVGRIEDLEAAGRLTSGYHADVRPEFKNEWTTDVLFGARIRVTLDLLEVEHEYRPLINS
jgi:hypothetical protein